MLFFGNEMAKTLSLTWSKKNLIGPEALYQDPRPKPKPKPTPTPSLAHAHAEPSRPGGGGARVGSLPLSPSCLSSHSEKAYLYHSIFFLLADVGYFPMTSYSFN